MPVQTKMSLTPAALVNLAIILSGLACSPDAPQLPPGDEGVSAHLASGPAKASPIALRDPFAPNNVFYVMKSGSPMVVVNMAPELDNLKVLDAVHQEEYILKRVVVNLIDTGLARKEYAGKDEFLVRVLIMTEVDEYGKGKWGSARELATFNTNRASLQKAKGVDLDAVSGDPLRAMFTNCQFALATIAMGSKN